MSRSSRSSLFLAAALALSTAGLTLAQGGPQPGSPIYDPKTEIKIKGTVAQIQPLQPGMHVTLRTEEGALDVHLGPPWFLKDKGVSLGTGDEIEVVGSRVKLGDKDSLIARQITKGDTHLVLRDERGIPAWSGGKRR